MSRTLLFLFLPALIQYPLFSQFERFGGGLTFSTGVDYNTIETGNPGVFGKAYIKMFKKAYFIPSASIYNRYQRSTVLQSFSNYMFQGDADIQYEILREGPLRLVGIAGANATGIVSNYEVFIGDPRYNDQTSIKPGLNLGAGVEIYIDRRMDSVLSAKYILGPWSQFVIQLSLVFHPYGQKRIGW